MLAQRLLLLLLLTTPSAPAQQRTIAITFDDLPMTVVGNDHIAGPLAETRYINSSILHILTAHHATALGLVNEAKLNVQGERDARAQLLEDWLAAGMTSSATTATATASSKTLSLPDYEAEFLRGDIITVPLAPSPSHPRPLLAPALPRHRRHPRQKSRPSITFLADHGYRIAPFTIQDDDWMFNATWDEARRQPDTDTRTATLNRTRTAYLDHINDLFNYAEAPNPRHLPSRYPPDPLHSHRRPQRRHPRRRPHPRRAPRLRLRPPRPPSSPTPPTAPPTPSSAPTALSWLDRWQPSLGNPVHPTVPEPPTWIQENYKRSTAPYPQSDLQSGCRQTRLRGLSLILQNRVPHISTLRCGIHSRRESAFTLSVTLQQTTLSTAPPCHPPHFAPPRRDTAPPGQLGFAISIVHCGPPRNVGPSSRANAGTSPRQTSTPAVASRLHPHHRRQTTPAIPPSTGFTM